MKLHDPCAGARGALMALACAVGLGLAAAAAVAAPGDPPGHSAPAPADDDALSALRASIDRLRRELVQQETRLRELETRRRETVETDGPGPARQPDGSAPVAAHHHADHAHHHHTPATPGNPGSPSLNPPVAAPRLVLGAGADFFGGLQVGRSSSDPFQLRAAKLLAAGTWTPRLDASLMLGLEPGGQVHLEQAFVRLATTGGGVSARLGKLRAAFGQVNGLCADELPWVDRPLVHRNLLGAGHGPVADTGASVTVRGRGLTGIVELYRGESVIFSREHDAVPAWATRATGTARAGPVTIDLGASLLRGPSASGPAMRTSVIGLDGRAATTTVELSGEWVRALQHAPGRRLAATGGFAAVAWQVTPTFGLAARLDRSHDSLDHRAVERGVAVAASWTPAELVRLRAQYGMEERAGHPVSRRLLAQVTFQLHAERRTGP